MEHVLFVCTGNVCRSPMAAAIAAALLLQRGAGVEVSSAGLLSAGRSSTREAEAVMARRSLDLSSHRSRQLVTALDGRPDLVVGMAQEHVRAVVDLQPELFASAFTLKDLVNRVKLLGERPYGEELADYLRRLGQDRRPADLVGMRPSEDIADPIGQSKRVYERCAAEIESLVKILVDLVWPVRASVAP